jgi:hypothetical protein
MKPIRTLLVLTLVTAGLLSAPSARAAENPLEFLHALRDGGYPDVAVDYLNALKKDPQAPKAVLDVWDWEMSRTLRADAKVAYDEKQAKRDTEQADALLKKFIAENPKRPEAIRAAAEWAATAADQALRAYNQANELTDKDQWAEAMAKVRASLEEVHARFAQAEEVNLQALKKTRASDRNRPQLEGEWLDSRLKVAMTDFYIAMTYPRKTPGRTKGMEKAAKTFDQVFQSYRTTIWGLKSHFFTGWALQEEDKPDDAKEIFDECLSPDAPLTTATDNPTRRGAKPAAAAATEMDDFFAEVERHYLQCVAVGSIRDYLREVIEWRAQKKALMEKHDGYQAISFDMAKVYLKKADSPDTSPADKQHYTALAVRILSEMVNIPSQYQDQAIKLRRQLRGGAESADNPEEAVVDAVEAVKAKKWTAAIELYKKVIVLLEKAKVPDTKRIAGAREAIAYCSYNIGFEQWHKEDLAAAAETLNRLIEDKQLRGTPAAQSAAALLLNVLLYQYNGMQEKTDEEKTAKADALQRLTETANRIIQYWPGKPEADAARLALERIKIVEANRILESPPAKPDADAARALSEQVALFQGKVDEAHGIFLQINPKAENYPTGLYLIGLTYWRGYSMEKRQIEAIEKGAIAGGPKVADDVKQRVDSWCQKAIKGMQIAVDTLKATPSPDGKPPKMLADSQLLLAEMMAAQSDPKAVVALLQPLADDLVKSKARGMDEVSFKICSGLVRAYLQLGDMDKAVKIAKLLLKLGPDAMNVNLVVMSAARGLADECKKARGALEEAQGSSETQAAKTRCEACEQLLGDLLGSLAAREKLTAASTVWLAQACVAADMNDEAEQVARNFFDRMENDANFINEGAKAVPRMRTLLVSVMRKKGKFAEALDQVDQLIAENPSALDPRMERGWILQAWCERKPEKYPQAVSCWEKLRRDLEQSGNRRPKNKPGARAEKSPELYDVTYNEALCLYNWARKAGDKENAKKALQLLKQMLLLDPQLNGPDTVSRFHSLVDKIEILMGLEPSSRQAASARKVDAPKSAAPAGKP